MLSNSQLKKPGPIDEATERLDAAIDRLESAVATKKLSIKEISKLSLDLPRLEGENSELRSHIQTTCERLDKIIKKIETVVEK